MKDQDLERTRVLLRGWGNWSHNNTGCHWYTQMCGLSNVLPVAPDLRYKLCDDDALVIDKLVACMMDEENPRPMTFLFFTMSMDLTKVRLLEGRQEKTKSNARKVRFAHCYF